MPDALEKEYHYYSSHAAELIAEYRGKFLVIKDQSVQAVCESESDAIREGLKKYELGTFLVQPCTDDETVTKRTFRSRVAF